MLRSSIVYPLVFSHSHGKWPIEIDGLPINSMVDLSMAMLVITRWYYYKIPMEIPFVYLFYPFVKHLHLPLPASNSCRFPGGGPARHRARDSAALSRADESTAPETVGWFKWDYGKFYWLVVSNIFYFP